MTKSRRQAIIVLGMHRSGTSALAGTLGLLGMRLPSRLMPPTIDNPKGYFESVQIYEIHERLLAAAGTNWFGIESLPADWFHSAEASAFVDELVAAVRQDYGDAATFVVKDPRMCRLMPLWRQVLDKVSAQARFAIPLRNPLEVARSLEKRDGLPLAHGCLLWLCHVLDAERETRGSRRVFFHYHDLLSDPARMAARIASQLTEETLALNERDERDISSLIDPELRHHVAEPKQLHRPEAFYPWLWDSYEASCALVDRPADKGPQRRLDRVRMLFEPAAASFAPLLAARDSALAERDVKITALDRTLVERDAKVAALDKALSESDHELGALRNALPERDAKISALDRTLVEREAKVATLGQALAKRDRELGRLRDALAERDANVAALDQTLAERDRELGGLRDTLAERDMRVAALGQEVVNLRSQLAGKAAELDQLFASFSWRLTSPLRKAPVKLFHVARLKTQRVEFRPLNQLRREAQAGSVTDWRMMGNDANFEIDLSRTGPLSPGHYCLMIELSKGLIELNSPKLYVDSGNGLSESDCLNLNFAERGRIGIASFSLAKGARALRFDPSVHPGRIAIGRAWLRRMSRIEHYSRLIARIVRYHINSATDLARAVKRAIILLATGGPRRLTAELRSAGSQDVDRRDDYQHWIKRYDTMTEADKAALRRRMQSLAWRPLISVIMPVYNTPEALLRKAIESVREQINDHWEMCIADDCSTAAHVREMLDYYTKLDPRIRVCFRTTNGHIAEASNSALAIAKGEFVALLDHDDEIPPHALALVADAIAAQPDVDLIFSDEDKLDAQGRRFDPYFKSKWNPALMLSQNCFSHLGVYRRSLVEKVGGFRLGFEGSQDHDLVLRCSRETTSKRIRHIPRILYHWRSIETSTAAGGGAKPYAWDAGRRAIEEHLAQKNIHAKVEHASRADSHYQVKYTVPTTPPRVSILIPTTAKSELIKPCLDSILERTTYDDFEVLVLVSETHRAMPDRAAYLSWASQQPRVRMLVYPDRPFNFSWVNNWGAGQATGDVLCLLNDDTEIITPDWLEKFVARVSLDGVGAVGPMMYFLNNTIQHAGVILGIGGVAAHVFNHEPRGSLGYFSRACLEQDLSCVTAGCMAIRKEAYLGIGGMDETFAIAFNDVDFCIRLRAAGWRIIWTPVVELYHRESVSVGRHNGPARERQFSIEIDIMRKLWGPVLDFDPNYNVNLSLSKPFSLAFPPRRTDSAEMTVLERDGTTAITRR